MLLAVRTNTLARCLLCTFATMFGSDSNVATAQSAQNPSPMVETTRRHGRLENTSPPGTRHALEIGTLFVPASLADTNDPVPLVVHFHGGDWLPETAAAQEPERCVLHVQLGAGSARYAEPFRDQPGRFLRLIDEAQSKSDHRFQPVMVSGWSAGYGAIREILQDPDAYRKVDGVLLLDGLHTGYVNGRPGPRESQLETQPLDAFLQLARDAANGHKRLVITHSEVFPGTYASTTETADYLLQELDLPRQAVLKWGPQGMQQLSDTRRGSFIVMGFAGNSAPDHIDHLHGVAEFWQVLFRQDEE